MIMNHRLVGEYNIEKTSILSILKMVFLAMESGDKSYLKWIVAKLKQEICKENEKGKFNHSEQADAKEFVFVLLSELESENKDLRIHNLFEFELNSIRSNERQKIGTETETETTTELMVSIPKNVGKGSTLE